MKSLVALFLIMALTVKINAQVNLVPNPSFEDSLLCPSSIGQINRCAFWYNANLGSSPDFFNSCASPSSGADVPQNAFGFQTARSGNAYTGVYVFNSPNLNAREYIQTQLLDSLTRNKSYCIRFYVCLDNLSNTAISEFGLYLSNTPLIGATFLTLPVTPQVISPSNTYLKDTLIWIQISSIYIATGGEQYITLGNFNNDIDTDTMSWNLNDPNCFPFCYPTSHYYIDDISIIEIKTPYAGADTVICPGDTVQIGSLPDSAVSYSWSPTTGLNNANISNPSASPSQTTTYYLTATASCDYISTDTIIVFVLTCDTSNTASSISIPNVFTPNNDHVNDLFKITTDNIATFNCKIYNRWGILVNELTSIHQSWDGSTATGIECSEGIYYFILSAEGADGKTYNETEFVQLIR